MLGELKRTTNMSGTIGENRHKATHIKQSIVEIPAPGGLQIPDDTARINGCNSPSRSRRSIWFGKSFGPLGKYGKLRKAEFVIGARNLEVTYTNIHVYAEKCYC